MSIPPRQVTPALLQVDAIVARLTGAQALGEVCRFLRHEFPPYHWVGVYRLESGTLHLVAWDGAAPTEHQTIPVGQGVCGRAARENRTVVVGDVGSAPEYLACFVDTRSEIVVPVRDHVGAVVGELDIDGNALNAYDRSDERFLEQVALKIAAPLESAGRAASTSG